MTSEPLDETYLKWLYSQVAEQDSTVTYWKLFKQLYTTEFVWLVPNDDNRLEDGKALRLEFIRHEGIDYDDVDPDWITIGCSVLELMVGLARRLEFEADGKPHYWFWRLVYNIGLLPYHDGVRRYPRQRIQDTLDMIIFRQYDRHGNGGFFPLRGPCADQRNVEIWYQLSAYVLELATAA